jgi:hypothetical protein
VFDPLLFLGSPVRLVPELLGVESMDLPNPAAWRGQSERVWGVKCQGARSTVHEFLFAMY